MAYHLAQVNIARMKAELDDPAMSGFARRIEEINALADGSKGFVWRFQTPEGDATYFRPFEDTRVLFNMSVWEGLDALRDYVYKSRHLDMLKAKADWFSRPGATHLALWWIERGRLPSVDEALERLALVRERGPSPDAFTFSAPYPPPADATEP